MVKPVVMPVFYGVHIMKNALLAKLEKSIEKFIEEDDDRDFFIYDSQIEDMAKAAAGIYDAAEKAQRFADSQKA